MPIDGVISGATTHHVACERAESFIDRLPDGCVSLMTLDFPYYGVKADAWDNAWPTPEAFIAWMGGVLAQCRRVLAPNGSLYGFASPQLADRISCAIREHLQILNHVVWVQPDASGAEKGARAGTTRSYVLQSERVLFAAHKGTPIGEVIAAARARAGISRSELGVRLGYVLKRDPTRSTGLSGWWETDPTTPGACVPTRAQYEAAMRVCGVNDAPDYNALVRPFNVSAEVPYTDIWTYPVVQPYPGKHPCEKPEDMARDIVHASSRPGDVVADFFCGSGVFLAAAVAEGRRAIGCDMDPHWAEQAQRRCDAVKATGRVVRTAPKPKDDRQRDLFSR